MRAVSVRPDPIADLSVPVRGPLRAAKVKRVTRTIRRLGRFQGRSPGRPSILPPLATIAGLAEEIPPIAPECADRAMKYFGLVLRARGEATRPGHDSHAIESQLGDDELSEPQVRSVTSAVIRSLKAE